MDSAAPAGFERRPRVLLATSAEPTADLREAIAAEGSTTSHVLPRSR